MLDITRIKASRRAALQGLALATAAGGMAAASFRPALAGDLLASIKKAGVVKAGIALDPPLSLQNKSGEWYGVIVDMLNAMGTKLGVRVELVATTWSTLVPGLLAGKYDMIGSCMSATEARHKVIDFTESYSAAGQIFIYSKDNTKSIASLESMNKKDVTVAYVEGTVQGEITRKLLPNANYRALTSGSIGDMVAEVQAGRSDVFNVDSILRRPILERFPWAVAIPNTDEGLNSIPNVWGVRKNEPELVMALNDFIAEAKTSGLYEQLLKKYDTPANAGM